MNKTELVKEIAQKTSFSQKDVKAVMEALQEVTFETLGQEEVKIMDGVTLTSVVRPAHDARSPLTGETVHVDEKVAPKAKFGLPVKNALNA